MYKVGVIMVYLINTSTDSTTYGLITSYYPDNTSLLWTTPPIPPGLIRTGRRRSLRGVVPVS